MQVLRLFPTSFKQWIKTHPRLANAADRFLVGRRRAIAAFTDIPTLMSANERELLFLLAKANDPRGVIVELGCWAGGSAYFLGKGALLSGSEVISIDPFGSELPRQEAEWDGTTHYKRHPKLAREG